MPKAWTCPDCGRLNDYYPYPTRCSRCGYLHTPEAVPEVLTRIEQFQLPIIPDVEKVWVSGSLARGQMTAKSDIDVIVQVSKEVFEEPMSFRLKTVEDNIWKKFPNADVFFTPKGNLNEMMQIPAWMKPGGKVDASVVKGLWEDAKVIVPTVEEIPPAVEEGDLECMICHEKFDHLILGTCESCYKKWTRGKV